MPGTLIPFDLRGTGTGVLQSVAIVGGSHSISAEGHPAFGGTDSSPSPLDYALAALVSCNQVTGQIVAAADRSTTLGAWDVRLAGHLDNSVLVFGEEGVSNFRDVTLTISVESNLGPEAFAHFVSEVERRCPVTELFRGSGVEYKTEWTTTPLAS